MARSVYGNARTMLQVRAKLQVSQEKRAAPWPSMLAQRIALLRSALSGHDDLVLIGEGPSPSQQVPMRSFRDPDPFHELSFPTQLATKRAIADEIRLPRGRLSDDDRRFIDALVTRALSRPAVLAAVHEGFPQGRKEGVVLC